MKKSDLYFIVSQIFAVGTLVVSNSGWWLFVLGLAWFILSMLANFTEK